MTRQQDHSTFAHAIIAVFPSGPKYEAWRNYITGLDTDDLIDVPKMYATLRTLERNHVGPFNIAHFHNAYIQTVTSSRTGRRPEYVGSGEFRHPGNHDDSCVCAGTGWTHIEQASPVTGLPTEYATPCTRAGREQEQRHVPPDPDLPAHNIALRLERPKA